MGSWTAPLSFPAPRSARRFAHFELQTATWRNSIPIAIVLVGHYAVATVVAFLASDQAAMINGETVAIDGGYTAL